MSLEKDNIPILGGLNVNEKIQTCQVFSIKIDPFQNASVLDIKESLRGMNAIFYTVKA